MSSSSCRYSIGDIFISVTFYSDNVINMKGQVAIEFENGEEHIISKELLYLIAKPAP